MDHLLACPSTFKNVTFASLSTLKNVTFASLLFFLKVEVRPTPVGMRLRGGSPREIADLQWPSHTYKTPANASLYLQKLFGVYVGVISLLSSGGRNQNKCCSFASCVELRCVPNLPRGRDVFDKLLLDADRALFLSLCVLKFQSVFAMSNFDDMKR